MENGYTYINKNGKPVRGRAADNNWMTEHGYNRVADLIDDVARRVAEEIKGEFDTTATNRKNITKATRSA